MLVLHSLAKRLLLVGTVVAVWSVSTPGLAQQAEPRLALKGYDPVAYFTMGRPVPGRPEFSFEVDDVVYQFATEEHLALFRSDPDHYAPRYGGLCTMGLAAKGYEVEANPENWVIHEGRLYVMQRSFGPAGFRKDPERWIAGANEQLAALKGAPIGSGLSWW
jgi:YHS domain-containing protein